MKRWLSTVILFVVLALLVLGLSGWGEMPEEPQAVDRAMVLEKIEKARPQAVDRAMVLAAKKAETKYFDVPLSEELQDHIFYLGEKYSINPALIISMIEKESSFDPSKVGDNGDSFGLMQVQKKWHIERMARLDCYNLLDPWENIEVGVDYLAELVDMRRGMVWALTAYNGGPTYANEKTEEHVITQYVRDVIERGKEIDDIRRGKVVAEN